MGRLLGDVPDLLAVHAEEVGEHRALTGLHEHLHDLGWLRARLRARLRAMVRAMVRAMDRVGVRARARVRVRARARVRVRVRMSFRAISSAGA